MRNPTITAIVLIASSVIAHPSWSQDNSAITGAVFTNPGARSIGLGGAFAAIADDATAAFANPSGLVQIVRPEISIELRFSSTMSDTEHGRNDDLSGLGFFSFVYPSQNSSRNWAIALYSHHLASIGYGFSYPQFEGRKYIVRSYAAAAALEISEHLSVGAGLSYSDGERSAYSGVSEFSDTDWSFNAGALWNVSRAWNLAGFYRQGPEFETRNSTTIFSFPSEYGFGVAFRPKAGALTLGFEWDRVGSTTDPLQDGRTVAEAGSERHLGVEYAVLRWKPVVAFRAGLWSESGRRYDVIRDRGADTIFFTEDRDHVTFGFGLASKRFQIDAGVDFFELDFVGSVSFVYSF